MFLCANLAAKLNFTAVVGQQEARPELRVRLLMTPCFPANSASVLIVKPRVFSIELVIGISVVEKQCAGGRKRPGNLIETQIAAVCRDLFCVLNHCVLRRCTMTDFSEICVEPLASPPTLAVARLDKERSSPLFKFLTNYTPTMHPYFLQIKLL